MAVYPIIIKKDFEYSKNCDSLVKFYLEESEAALEKQIEYIIQNSYASKIDIFDLENDEIEVSIVNKEGLTKTHRIYSKNGDLVEDNHFNYWSDKAAELLALHMLGDPRFTPKAQAEMARFDKEEILQPLWKYIKGIVPTFIGRIALLDKDGEALFAGYPNFHKYLDLSKLEWQGSPVSSQLYRSYAQVEVDSILNKEVFPKKTLGFEPFKRTPCEEGHGVNYDEEGNILYRFRGPFKVILYEAKFSPSGEFISEQNFGIDFSKINFKKEAA